MPDSLRGLPSVEKVLQAIRPVDLPRPLVVGTVRAELAKLRKSGAIPEFEAIVGLVENALGRLVRERLQPLINATGVIIHTNLGRAPLSAEAMEAMARVGRGYCNLELDLAAGQRGKRAPYLDRALAVVCGAESALVVNNCAAALVLVLRHFTARKLEVIISRGELVQIGGGFRIPEILEASGARLREVGTTNRTVLADYAKAIGPESAIILKVHHSNFYMDGFVEAPSRQELAQLARSKRIPLVEDLGSGAMAATEKLGLDHEPTPAEILKSGVHLVTCSCDQLLGGPQAGMIAGQQKLIAALRKEPLFRALRCDKLILAALQTTIDAYLAGGAERTIPVLALLRASVGDLKARAEAILTAIQDLPVKATIEKSQAEMGGGTLPRSKIPSVALALSPESVSTPHLAALLRHGTPPVIGYISGNKVKLDLRTVFPNQDRELVQAIRQALAGSRQPCSRREEAHF